MVLRKLKHVSHLGSAGYSRPAVQARSSVLQLQLQPTPESDVHHVTWCHAGTASKAVLGLLAHIYEYSVEDSGKTDRNFCSTNNTGYSPAQPPADLQVTHQPQVSHQRNRPRCLDQPITAIHMHQAMHQRHMGQPLHHRHHDRKASSSLFTMAVFPGKIALVA